METEVMTLGALPNVPPTWRMPTFLNPPPTTPQQPQNLLRPVYVNGLGAHTWMRWPDRPLSLRGAPTAGQMTVPLVIGAAAIGLLGWMAWRAM